MARASACVREPLPVPLSSTASRANAELCKLQTFHSNRAQQSLVIRPGCPTSLVLGTNPDQPTLPSTQQVFLQEWTWHLLTGQQVVQPALRPTCAPRPKLQEGADHGDVCSVQYLCPVPQHHCPELTCGGKNVYPALLTSC